MSGTAPPAPLIGESRLALCAVGDAARPPRSIDLAATIAWFDAVSNGSWRPLPVELPSVTLDHPLDRYRMSRGIDPKGVNAQDLAASVVAALGEKALADLRGADGRLVLVTAAAFHPHVWRPRRGGIPLAGSAWCRRYAVLPDAAPLGTIAHELAHLLLGWRDGDGSNGAAMHCLMGRGGLRGGGREPTPPCAALLHEAGWRRAIGIDRDLTVEALAESSGSVGTIVWSGRTVAADIRDGLLLASVLDDLRPSCLAAIPVAGCRHLSVLGLIAPSLRRSLGPFPDAA